MRKALTRPHLKVAGIASAAAAAAQALAFVTYREPLDGPLPLFISAVLLGVVAIALTAIWSLARSLPAWATVVALATIAFPFPALHAYRLSGRHVVVVETVEPPAAYRRLFDLSLNGGAGLSLHQEDLVLTVPALSIGFLELRRVEIDDQIGARWWLPRALSSPSHQAATEELSWEASISRDNVYVTLVEANEVVAEVTSWGVQITKVSANNQPVAQGVNLPSTDRAWQTWSVRRAGSALRIFNGGREIWSGPVAGALRRVRLGETRSDAEHGGTLRLRAIRYTRSLT